MKNKKPIILCQPEIIPSMLHLYKVKFHVVNNGQRKCEAKFIFKPYYKYKEGDGYVIDLKDNVIKIVDNIQLDIDEKMAIYTATIAHEQLHPYAYLEINIIYTDKWRNILTFWKRRKQDKTFFYQINDNGVISAPNAKKLVPANMRAWENDDRLNQ